MNRGGVRPEWGWDWYRLLLATIGAACLGWGFYRFLTGYVARGVIGDFAVYYQAAQDLLQGLPVYEAAVSSPNGFLYPPVSLGFFVLFTPFPPVVAYALFAVIVYGSTALAAWLFMRQVGKTRGIAIPPVMMLAGLLFALGFAPTYSNVASGQVNTLVLLLCVLFLILIERRPAFSGVLLGVAAWIKVYPALLGVFVLVHPRYRRVMVGLAGIFVAAPLALAWFIPLSLYRQYFLDILPQVSSIGTVHIMNQSVTAAVQRFMRPLGSAFGWDLYTLSPMARWASMLAIGAGAAAVVLWLRRDLDRRKPTAFAVLLAMIPMLVSIGWGYTYVLVLPLVLLILLSAGECGWRWQLTALALVAGFMLPAYSELQIVNRLPEPLAQIFYARYALATLAMVVAVFALQRGAALTPGTIGPAAARPEHPTP